MSSGSRLVLVGEPDPAVQLGVAGELPVEAGHTDQDQAEIASVEEVPELFQPSGSQAVSLIDDHQLGVALGFFVVELGVVSRVERAFDVVAQAVDMEAPTSRFSRRAVIVSSGVYMIVSSGVYISVRLSTSDAGMANARWYRCVNQYS